MLVCTWGKLIAHILNCLLVVHTQITSSNLVFFSSVENSVICLVGLLTGLDAEMQLESAWCLTNIAAGTDSHASVVVRHAGPYLVTFLSSVNIPLQVNSLLQRTVLLSMLTLTVCMLLSTLLVVECFACSCTLQLQVIEQACQCARTH